MRAVSTAKAGLNRWPNASRSPSATTRTTSGSVVKSIMLGDVRFTRPSSLIDVLPADHKVHLGMRVMIVHEDVSQEKLGRLIGQVETV
jgi:hypothetical protein